ncbi:MAG: hypothetical protein ACO2O2_04130 [Acidilobaceae archaeon]
MNVKHINFSWSMIDWGSVLVDIVTVLSILIPVLASILVSVASLAYWLGRKFTLIDERFEKVNERFEKFEREFSSFRDIFIQYNEILISLLEARGILSKGEVLALRGFLGSLRPQPASKYYTEEVARRLDELLAKDPEELTLADLRELDRIADLIWNEGYESGRVDLREYAMKLKLYVMMVKVVFIYPKLRERKVEGSVKPQT